MPNPYEQTINDQIERVAELEADNKLLRIHADRLAGAVQLVMDKAPQSTFSLNVSNQLMEAWAEYDRYRRKHGQS